jgi:hypothetical protein
MIVHAAATAAMRTTTIALRPPVWFLARCRDAGERTVAAAVEDVIMSRQTAILVERIADRLLQQELADRFLERVLASPELERLLTVALDNADLERLVTRVVESRLTEATMDRLVDEAATRLPQSEALWSLIDEVAASPAVADAIAIQSRGMGEDVAADVRRRSRDADAWLERLAGRMLRRRASGGGPAPGAPQPMSP